MGAKHQWHELQMLKTICQTGFSVDKLLVSSYLFGEQWEAAT